MSQNGIALAKSYLWYSSSLKATNGGTAEETEVSQPFDLEMGYFRIRKVQPEVWYSRK
jgi:hypothetical protein